LLRDIIHWGDPRLIADNSEVDPAAEDLSGLIADMVAACHAAPGVGLAAPQVGVSLRLFVYDDGEGNTGAVATPELSDLGRGEPR